MPIAVVGDYREEFATHRVMLPALLRFARERRVPLLGTCGGFQNVLIEFARNVLGIVDADSAEHTGGERVCFLPGSRLRRIIFEEDPHPLLAEFVHLLTESA